MSLIQYELRDENDLNKGLYVYANMDESIDNQILLDEILKSEWKYVADMDIYFEENQYNLTDYARENFTYKQNGILRKYMIEGAGEMMDLMMGSHSN
jgi:hypothetical protein